MAKKLKFDMLSPGDIVACGEDEYVVVVAKLNELVAARVDPVSGEGDFVIWQRDSEGDIAFGWFGGWVEIDQDEPDRIVRTYQAEIEAEPATEKRYKVGDVVAICFTNLSLGGALTGRLIRTSDEADILNGGGIPERWGAVGVRPLAEEEESHYFECSDAIVAVTARSIQSTTCGTCLLRRAQVLRGWRWTAPHNEKEVAFLVERLGEQVAGFGKAPADEESTDGA